VIAGVAVRIAAGLASAELVLGFMVPLPRNGAGLRMVAAWMRHWPGRWSGLSRAWWVPGRQSSRCYDGARVPGHHLMVTAVLIRDGPGQCFPHLSWMCSRAAAGKSLMS